MDQIKFKIKQKVFNCLVAKSAEDRKTGYSGEQECPKDNECMLFVFPVVGKNQMWMAGTEFPLDIVFLNEDLKVTEILCGEVGSEELLGTGEDVAYVLEFACGVCDKMGLKQGNSINSIPEEILEPGDESYDVFVLDEDGEIQMEIQGGERIFSRKSTRKIVSQAQACEGDKDFRKLARTVLREILAQDGRGSQYVKGKTKEVYELAE